MGFRSLAETRAHIDELDDEERASLERARNTAPSSSAANSNPPTSLANITEPSFTLVWDDYHDGPDKHETVIKLADRIIFSEPGGCVRAAAEGGAQDALNQLQTVFVSEAGVLFIRIISDISFAIFLSTAPRNYGSLRTTKSPSRRTIVPY